MSTATARAVVTNLEIEQCVHEKYGFVPHPYWISHCRQLYLQMVCEWPRKPWHECPPDKCEAIREAFLYFGSLP